jgi:NitT/TauT family transport system ATP-binding protein
VQQTNSSRQPTADSRQPFDSRQPTADSPSKILVEGATKAFSEGAVIAFEDLELSVRPKEVLCIVGPSGCGKTTLLRSIDGLVSLTRGRILIDGEEVREPRTSVAMVFQHFGLFPWKTVRANIGYGLKLRKTPRQETESALTRVVSLVGLEGFERSYPYQLSGGMQQRVGLARALAVDPDILLMDEPFASLDAQTRELLQEELLRIMDAQPKTMVFITHSIDEAIVLGDRIAVMTARPARIRELLDVPFARPRSIVEVKASDQFTRLREHLWMELKQEAA